jgi:hypothetical protein
MHSSTMDRKPYGQLSGNLTASEVIPAALLRVAGFTARWITSVWPVTRSRPGEAPVHVGVGWMHLGHPPATRASCLNLLSNAVLVWNTIPNTQVLGQLPAVRHEIADQDLARSSPLMHAHVIPNRTYRVGE